MRSSPLGQLGVEPQTTQAIAEQTRKRETFDGSLLAPWIDSRSLNMDKQPRPSSWFVA